MLWRPGERVQAVGLPEVVVVVDEVVDVVVVVVGLDACVWVVWVVPPPLVATRMIARMTRAPRSAAAVRKPGRVQGLRRSPGSWGLRGAIRGLWQAAA